jgi:hypothetical protein
MKIDMLYLYLAARDDGLNFAVGARFTDGPANGAYALFAGREAALVFLDAMREQHGVRAEIMPSAAVAVTA